MRYRPTRGSHYYYNYIVQRSVIVILLQFIGALILFKYVAPQTIYTIDCFAQKLLIVNRETEMFNK